MKFMWLASWFMAVPEEIVKMKLVAYEFVIQYSIIHEISEILVDSLRYHFATCRNICIAADWLLLFVYVDI